MNFKKEILERNLDLDFRQKELEAYIALGKKQLDSFQKNVEETLEKEFSSSLKIPYEKKPRKERKDTFRKVFVRDPKVSQNALQNANYCCEINPLHTTFIKRSNQKKYMEPHHLIPLEFQSLFTVSLDVEANIVSLCSHCHNEIHYGVNFKNLIKVLYFERKEDLKQCGIEIDLETLYQMYDFILKKDLILN